MVLVTTGVADFGRDNSGDVVKLILYSPESTTAEDSCLLGYWHLSRARSHAAS
jgi:hypothetical protein